VNKIKRLKRARHRRQHHVRHTVGGTQAAPRLAVFRSLKHIYCQLIDDASGQTVASSSSMTLLGKDAYGGNKGAAEQVGKDIAQKAKDAGVERAVFDRRWYKFHGRVKALAESARANGLKI
jgi:large subunit ribosomal protein L18